MTDNVVVLGAGYAGAGAIKSLESRLGSDADLIWVSENDHHLVLHESHRCIRDPSVAEKVTIPVEAIKSAGTTFVQGRVVDIDTDDRLIDLEDGDAIDYDYLLVAIGSRTAFFGIEGLREHAHTLKSLDDALGIHDAVLEATGEGSPDDPAQVIVGGAGLSGVQVAGEIAGLRDDRSLPLEITVVEGLDQVLPNGDAPLQRAIRQRLEAAGVGILTGEFVSEVDADTVYVGEDGELDYDVLVWTGGITGHEAIEDVAVDKDERSHRIDSGQDFRTSDERVFAIGDCALIDQNDDPAPPTAEAAWEAAEVAGKNLARAVRDQPLEEWSYESKGTAVSIGHDAVAHDVFFLPGRTFGGFLARTLKKGIAARWITSITGVGRAVRAWPDM
ncbi:MAG: NAD(P)/FAD-dependent oxidoreductase [Haloarculaceae archaeon]